MPDESDVAAAINAHDAFEPTPGDGTEGTFAVTTTPFDAVVRVAADHSPVRYRITVRVPTLNAVVRGDEVAPVVRDGWFETFERRLEDIGSVTMAPVEPPSVRRDDEEVVVTTGFEADPPSRAIEDAKAIVDFIEGTYVQGIIPGYEYRDPARSLIDRAHGYAQPGG